MTLGSVSLGTRTSWSDVQKLLHTWFLLRTLSCDCRIRVGKSVRKEETSQFPTESFATSSSLSPVGGVVLQTAKKCSHFQHLQNESIIQTPSKVDTISIFSNKYTLWYNITHIKNSYLFRHLGAIFMELLQQRCMNLRTDLNFVHIYKPK